MRLGEIVTSSSVSWALRADRKSDRESRASPVVGRPGCCSSFSDCRARLGLDSICGAVAACARLWAALWHDRRHSRRTKWVYRTCRGSGWTSSR